MKKYPFPNIKTELPGPLAKQVIDKDDKYVSPSYTRDYPCVADQGKGAILTDIDGNEFLDFCAGIHQLWSRISGGSDQASTP